MPILEDELKEEKKKKKNYINQLIKQFKLALSFKIIYLLFVIGETYIASLSARRPKR